MSFHRQRTSLGLCSDFQRGGCTSGCNWFKTTQKHFVFTFRFIIKKILPVVWIITLNLNCYIFPHKNAGAFNGFNRDGVIKRAGANGRTAGAGAPTNKPSTPVWLQIQHAARCSLTVQRQPGMSPQVLSWWKKISGREQKVGKLDQIVRGQRKKSWRERRFHQSLGSVYRDLLVTYLPIFRRSLLFWCSKRYLQVTHVWTLCPDHHIQAKITRKKASVTFFEVLCN